MKKFTLNSFADVRVSVEFLNPKDILDKLILKLTKSQREDFFDELEELYHEDFAKRVLASPDFFFGKTFETATKEEELTVLYLTNNDTRKIINRVIDFTDPSNFANQSEAKINVDKINDFLDTLK